MASPGPKRTSLRPPTTIQRPNSAMRNYSTPKATSEVVRRVPSFLPRARNGGGLKAPTGTQGGSAGDGRPRSRLGCIPEKKSEPKIDPTVATGEEEFIKKSTTPPGRRALAPIELNTPTKNKLHPLERPGTPTPCSIVSNKGGKDRGQTPSTPTPAPQAGTNTRKKLAPVTAVSVVDREPVGTEIPQTPIRQNGIDYELVGTEIQQTPIRHNGREGGQPLRSIKKLRLKDLYRASAPSPVFVVDGDEDVYMDLPLAFDGSDLREGRNLKVEEEECGYTPTMASRKDMVEASSVDSKAIDDNSLEGLQTLKSSLLALQTQQTAFTVASTSAMASLQAQVTNNQHALNTTITTFLTTLTSLQSTLATLTTSNAAAQSELTHLRQSTLQAESEKAHLTISLQHTLHENNTLSTRLQDLSLLLPDPDAPPSPTTGAEQPRNKPIPLLLSGFPSLQTTPLAALEQELIRMLTALNALELPYPLRLPTPLPVAVSSASPGALGPKMKTLSSQTIDFLSWPAQTGLASVFCPPFDDGKSGKTLKTPAGPKTPKTPRFKGANFKDDKTSEKVLIWCASEKVVRFLGLRYQGWASGELKEGRELVWGVARGWA